MIEKYPAHVIPKIKTAAKRITEKTDLGVSVKVKGNRGDQVFIFSRLENKKPVQGDLFTAAPPPALPDDVMQKLPAGDRVSCQKICQEIITRDGVEGLRFYIDKAAGRKQSDRSSTSGYLKTIFDLDLFADIKAAKQAAAHQAQADHQTYLEQAAMDQKQAQDRERKQAALAALKADPEKYHAALVEAAKALNIHLDNKKRGDALKLDLFIMGNYET